MQSGLTSWSKLRILLIAAVCSVSLLNGQDNLSSPPQDSENPATNSEITNPPGSAQAELPVPRWLEGPSRQDFRWNVHAFPPILTYRQRQLVSIEATFRAVVLRKAGFSGGLDFVLKLADQDGHWLPGSSGGHFEMPPKVAPGDHVRALFAMYVEPGAYKATLVALDNRTNKGNLWRETIRVQPIFRDPLPESEEKPPAVEFLPPAPPFASGRGWMMTHNPWDFSQGTLTIPVANDAPLEVDVVANLSLSDSANSRHSEAPQWMYQINAATVTEISRVLSEMDLKSGCVRLSALDIPRQELIADREDTRDFDWSRIQTAMEAQQRTKINVHTLAGAKKTPSFLATYLNQLADDPPQCKLPDEKTPVRVLIVVSDAFTFPYGTEMAHARPSNAWARCYYMELVPVAGAHWD